MFLQKHTRIIDQLEVTRKHGSLSAHPSKHCAHHAQSYVSSTPPPPPLPLPKVGDGTTSVVLLAGEILKNCKPFIEDNVHPQIIVRGLRKATQLALSRIKDIAVHVKRDDPE